jgi:hypothetical protein
VRWQVRLLRYWWVGVLALRRHLAPSKQGHVWAKASQSVSRPPRRANTDSGSLPHPSRLMSSAKRPLSGATANRAERAYAVRTRLPTQAESSWLSVRRRGPGGRDEACKAGWYSQTSPFRPNGSFQTEETADVKYAVDPAADWSAMTRYHSFVCTYFLRLAPPCRVRPAQVCYPSTANKDGRSGQGQVRYR